MSKRNRFKVLNNPKSGLLVPKMVIAPRTEQHDVRQELVTPQRSEARPFRPQRLGQRRAVGERARPAVESAYRAFG